jgi:hypothetical protein
MIFFYIYIYMCVFTTMLTENKEGEYVYRKYFKTNNENR